VDVEFGAFEEKEAVVVDEFGSAVETAEGVEVFAFRIMYELARVEIESGSVEFKGFGEVGDAEAEMT